MTHKLFSELDLSGENTVDVDNDRSHFALLDAEEVKQKSEIAANYLTSSKIEGQPKESLDNWYVWFVIAISLLMLRV